MSIMRALLVLFATSITFSASALLLGDAEHGAQLHAAKCAGCHDAQFAGKGEQMYLRKERMVKTVEGLLARVEFCNQQIRIGLSEDEINDLVKYLNDTFYKFEVH